MQYLITRMNTSVMEAKNDFITTCAQTADVGEGASPWVLAGEGGVGKGPAHSVGILIDVGNGGLTFEF